MFFAIKQLSLPFIGMVALSPMLLMATFTADSETSTSTALTTELAYPPSGLLDSLASMKLREESYLRDVRESADSQTTKQPSHAKRRMFVPTSILSEMGSIEDIYSSLLGLADRVRSTVTKGPTSTPSYYWPTGPVPTATDAAQPTSPPSMTNFATPDTSDGPPLHVALSLVWVIVITFILIVSLSSACGGPANGITVLLICGFVAAIIIGADAHPRPHAHPLRRPIGGMRPGPVGKIPCGEVTGTIGSTGEPGKLDAVRPKGYRLGGLKGEMEKMYCDDWSNANFERGLEAMPVSPLSESETTTTILTTTTSTIIVTVPDAATQVSVTKYRLGAPVASTTASPPSNFYAVTTSAKSQARTTTQALSSPSPPLITGYLQEPSAAPPSVNIRNSINNLLFLYLFSVLFCLLFGGPTCALSFLLVSFVVGSIFVGAEAAVVSNPESSDGSLSTALELIGRGEATSAPCIDAKGPSSTHASGTNRELAALMELCSQANNVTELFCHNWNDTLAQENALVTTDAAPPLTTFEKRMSTVYVTILPTEGTIAVIGPQIIPVTVDKTIYENELQTTVDVVTEQRTRTKVVTVDAATEERTRTKVVTVDAAQVQQSLGYIGPGTTTTLSNRMSNWSARGPKTVTLKDNAPLPSAFPSLYFASPPLDSSTESSASSLDPTSLYLSFVETNLYCFLFLFIGLNIALTTSSPLFFLGSMVALMVIGAAVLEMCAGGQGVLRCNGVV